MTGNPDDMALTKADHVDEARVDEVGTPYRCRVEQVCWRQKLFIIAANEGRGIDSARILQLPEREHASQHSPPAMTARHRKGALATSPVRLSGGSEGRRSLPTDRV